MTVGELLDRVADQFFLVQIILEFMETIVIFLLENVLKSWMQKDSKDEMEEEIIP